MRAAKARAEVSSRSRARPPRTCSRSLSSSPTGKLGRRSTSIRSLTNRGSSSARPWAEKETMVGVLAEARTIGRATVKHRGDQTRHREAAARRPHRTGQQGAGDCGGGCVRVGKHCEAGPTRQLMAAHAIGEWWRRSHAVHLIHPPFFAGSLRSSRADGTPAPQLTRISHQLCGAGVSPARTRSLIPRHDELSVVWPVSFSGTNQPTVRLWSER